MMVNQNGLVTGEVGRACTKTPLPQKAEKGRFMGQDWVSNLCFNDLKANAETPVRKKRTGKQVPSRQRITEKRGRRWNRRPIQRKRDGFLSAVSRL